MTRCVTKGRPTPRSLEEAGVPTTCTRYDGMIHGFFGMAGTVDKGDQAIAEAATAMKKAFAASK